MNDTAKLIVRILQLAGFEAFFVGGSVRDSLIGKEPHDIDIATSATPDQVEHIFNSRAEFRVKEVGAAFGVVLLKRGDEEFEVASFRADQFEGKTDGRRPSSVKLNATSAEDAQRRDFTINALFQDPTTGKITDHVGGLADIENHIIRFVGDPNQRIEEDSLRMLRAVRFALKLGWDIEEKSFLAIRRSAEKINRISAERITLELEKMLACRNPRMMLALLEELHLLRMILPEVAALRGVKQSPIHHPEGDAMEHTKRVMQAVVNESFELQMAAMLHDIGKATNTIEDEKGIHSFAHEKEGASMAEAICRRLKLSVEQTERITWLVLNHMKLHFNAEGMKLATLRRLVAHPFFEDLHKLAEADCKGSRGDTSTLEAFDARIAKLPKEKDLPQPLITGNDLKALGLKPGPSFKSILTYIQDMQLEGKLQTKADALKELDSIISTL